MVEQRTIRVGTRGSALARVQTELFVAALTQAVPDLCVETVVLNTSGDADKQTPLSILGGQGIFAKELEAALLSGQIDLAVHSAKDLTSELPNGLALGAVLNRADPRDVFLTADGRHLEDLSAGARVGTSSRRRVMQLRQARPDLRPVELRGNVDTRLRKLANGEVDAAIMAAAGILRMGWGDRITNYLPIDTFVPAPGQGALGIECRADDQNVRSLLEAVNEEDVAAEVATERAFLRAVGGGCQSPIGAFARIDRDTVTLHGMLADEELTVACYQNATSSLERSTSMAHELAEHLQQAISMRQARRLT
jgi:hydroxymethylbilane synthase